MTLRSLLPCPDTPHPETSDQSDRRKHEDDGTRRVCLQGRVLLPHYGTSSRAIMMLLARRNAHCWIVSRTARKLRSGSNSLRGGKSSEIV